MAKPCRDTHLVYLLFRQIRVQLVYASGQSRVYPQSQRAN